MQGMHRDINSKNKNSRLKECLKICIDSLSCPLYYKNILKKNNIIFEKIDPIYFIKSIKNNTEIKNMKKTHMKSWKKVSGI